MQLSYAQAVGLCQRYGFPDPHLAAAVGMAESGGNTDAINRANADGSIDRGFFQINSVHGALSTTDVDGNFRAALKVSSGGRDWSPWVQYNNGAYRRYLDRSVKPQAVSVAGAGARKPSGGAADGRMSAPVDSGGLFGEGERSGALRALLWIAFVIGGAALAGMGLARMFGLGRALPAARAARAVTG